MKSLPKIYSNHILDDILGPPEPLTGCQLVNISTFYLEVGCTDPKVEDASQPESFYHLEVWEQERGQKSSGYERLLLNLSTPVRPHFTARGLSPETLYKMLLYVSNENGVSDPFSISRETGALPKVETSKSKCLKIVGDM